MDTIESKLNDYKRFLNKVRKEQESINRRVKWFTEAYEVTGDFPYSLTAQHLGASIYVDNTENLDKDATLNLLGNIARLAVNLGYKVDKNYSYDDFELRVWLDKESYDYVTYYAKRDVVCTSKVVGYKNIPGTPAKPPTQEPIIEWDCEAVSLLDHADAS